LYKSNKAVTLNNNSIKINILATKTFVYNVKPYKKHILCESLNNFTLTIPGIENLNVGKVIYNIKWIINGNSECYYKGLLVYVYQLPPISILSNVYNNLNNKATFAKSAGTFCKLRKSKKSKGKLITIQLPSLEEIYINKMTKAYMGKNTNFYVKSLTEGKYGFGFHVKKKINVRGVAMNPVDHPNGGRTKSVQPEKSP
jgi:ribosomal protein L2